MHWLPTLIIRVEAAIMRWVVSWDTACNFNAVISNQSIFNGDSIGICTIVIVIQIS